MKRKKKTKLDRGRYAYRTFNLGRITPTSWDVVGGAGETFAVETLREGMRLIDRLASTETDEGAAKDRAASFEEAEFIRTQT